jgi:FkbM family methyltransferase
MAKDKSESKKPKIIEDVEKSKIEVQYCIPLEQRDAQVRESTQRIKGRIQPGPITNEPIAIVGFGPSLNDTWQELRKFKYIMTGSGSHKFLVDRGIIPTHHVEVDPREHKIGLMGPPQPQTEYLIASACHPKLFDHLEGFNVKLWHIHTGDPETTLPTVFPRGEWILTGGSNVSLRAMVIARFMGFVNQHIFGMDSSMSNDGKSHADFHPKGSKGYYLTTYDKVEYKVTQPLVEYSRQFFHELKQMPEVEVTMYGEGMLQHLFRNKYVPAAQRKKTKKDIAVIMPKVISDEYLKLNRELHESNPNYGVSGEKRVDIVLKLSESLNTKNILDYGCGKGMLAKKLPFPIWEYDPAIPGKDTPPKPADLVICTDVLEHIEPDLLDNVIADLARCTKECAYVVVHTKAALKTLADGRNAHLIQEGATWWEKRLSAWFDVSKIIDKDYELHIVLGPKQAAKTMTESLAAETATIDYNGTKLVYSTPNDTTRWRANTLLTKEPGTIEWLNEIQEGEVLVDIGANVGMYTVFAAKVRGANVLAFEPESQNYAVLNKNISLNNLGDQVKAYCVGLSDSYKFTDLHLSELVAGGSCHSADKAVDFKLQPTTPQFSQGCVLQSLDNLVAAGMPQPDHIKIDVDGFEHLAVEGAKNTIKNVKSLIIETNPNLNEHMMMIKTLADLGFSFESEQVSKAARKDGAFKGVAEYVFRRR